jgi:methyl acetate hydrolase
MTEHKVPSMLGANAPLESYLLPLVFEPGTRFNYSIGIDFAGFIVAAASGMSLEDYFQKNIFEPCGVTSISFHPPTNYEAKKQAMCERVPVHTGKVKVMDGPAMGRTFDPKAIGPFYCGGGGLFGTARDYLKVLTKVLTSAESESLISPKSFKALFVDGTPDLPIVKADLARMATGQCIHDPAILTEGTGQHIGYSPGLFLNFIDSKWGRLAMSGFWDGAAKTMFWIDPSTGIAVSLGHGIAGGQPIRTCHIADKATGGLLYQPSIP